MIKLYKKKTLYIKKFIATVLIIAMDGILFMNRKGIYNRKSVLLAALLFVWLPLHKIESFLENRWKHKIEIN
jgi:hypothetical protein